MSPTCGVDALVLAKDIDAVTPGVDLSRADVWIHHQFSPRVMTEFVTTESSAIRAAGPEEIAAVNRERGVQSRVSE